MFVVSILPSHLANSTALVWWCSANGSAITFLISAFWYLGVFRIGAKTKCWPWVSMFWFTDSQIHKCGCICKPSSTHLWLLSWDNLDWGAETHQGKPALSDVDLLIDWICCPCICRESSTQMATVATSCLILLCLIMFSSSDHSMNQRVLNNQRSLKVWKRLSIVGFLPCPTVWQPPPLHLAQQLAAS